MAHQDGRVRALLLSHHVQMKCVLGGWTRRTRVCKYNGDKTIKMNNDLIAIYMERFVNRVDIWGRQWVNRASGNSGYACQKPDMKTREDAFSYRPVSSELVRHHLDGLVTAAWPAIDGNARSKWICFDSDVEDGSMDRLDSSLRSWGVHLVREGRRAGRDGHLWVLFDAPVSVEQLIILAESFMRLAGVSGIERFPKSAIGLSQVRGPLGFNLKPDANGARSWFDGVERDVAVQLEWLARQPLNKAADAIREAEAHRPAPHLSRTPRNQFAPRVQFQILNYMDAISRGGELVAQCPICALEGHDRHQDNLRIKADGSKFCCVFGGPSQVHRNRDIIRLLLATRRNAS